MSAAKPGKANAAKPASSPSSSLVSEVSTAYGAHWYAKKINIMINDLIVLRCIATD